MQTILATGATGLVGSRFVEMFKDKYDVINLDLTTGVDITRAETFKPFFDSHPDAKALIHLAAFTDTNAAFAQTGDKNGICYKVNVDGTNNIANICKERGIHLIHVSTDFVFDGKKEAVYTENDSVSPIEWYGETKAMAEKVVIESGVSYSITRLAYPYRAHFEAKPDLVKKIRTGLESGKLYPQFTDTIITPTFIDDIARAFDKLIELKSQGIFHTVGSSSLSPYELARKVALAYGFDPSMVKKGTLSEYLKTAQLASTSDGESRRAARPFAPKVALSNQKASTLLNLHFMTIDEGLSEIKQHKI